MTDQVDMAQLKLEGKCVECRELLPEHSVDCGDHPRKFLLTALELYVNKNEVPQQE
jgi:hypothetical protein